MPVPPRAVAPPPRRSGCLGAIALLFKTASLIVVVAIALGGYLLFERLTALSSTARGDVPAFTDTFDAYAPAQKKINAFERENQASRPGTLRLTADEINAILSRSDMSLRHNTFFFVTLNGDTMRLQISLPTENVSLGLARGRYFNFDTRFTVAIDPRHKALVLTPEAFQVGGQDLLATSGVENVAIRYVLANLAAGLNAELRQSPDTARILQTAGTVGIQDGELLIETH